MNNSKYVADPPSVKYAFTEDTHSFRFPRELIDDLKSRVNLSDWIEHLGVDRYKQTCRFYCPFCSDGQNPDFSVKTYDDGTQVATDWHTGEHYDHFSIAEELQGWDFRETLVELATFSNALDILDLLHGDASAKANYRSVPGHQKKETSSKPQKVYTDEESRDMLSSQLLGPDASDGDGLEIQIEYLREHIYPSDAGVCKRVIWLKTEIIKDTSETTKTKDVLWFTKQGTGWILGRKVPATLYNCQILASTDCVCLVEGEKDVDNLKEVGIPAVTAGSAGDHKSIPNFAELFTGKSVVIIPDNDPAGANFVQNVGILLSKTTASIKVVKLPGLREKEDVSDWLQYHGGNQEKLAELIKIADYFVPENIQMNDRSSDYEAIQSITDRLLRTSEFPLEVFPRSLQILFADIARNIGVDVKLVASCSLPIASNLIGNSVTVRVKPKWDEHLWTWFVIIGGSGKKKTPTLHSLMEVVNKLHAEKYEQWKRLDAAFRQEEQQKHVKGIPPVFSGLFTNNITVESCAQKMHTDHNGLMIFKDELAGFIKSFSEYKQGRGGDSEFWLECWDGRSYQVDRKSSPPLYIPYTGVAILGGIQPGLVRQTFSEESFTNGWISRFLFSVIPDTTLIQDDNTDYDITEWDSMAHRLLSIRDSSSLGVPMSLTNDAYLRFKTFRKELEDKNEFLEEKYQIFIPKLISYCVRLAGILHCMDYGRNGVDKLIERETMDKAISLTLFFLGEVKNILRLYTKQEQKPRDRHCLIEAVLKCRSKVKSGSLSIRDLADEYKKMVPPEVLTGAPNRCIAAMLRTLGFDVKSGTGNATKLRWDEALLANLSRAYGIHSSNIAVNNEPFGTSATKCTDMLRADLGKIEL